MRRIQATTVAELLDAEEIDDRDPETAADRASNWARFRAKPRAERRIAIVFGDSRDAAASAVAILRAFATAGYRVGDIPADGAALIARLRADADERLQLNAYAAVFAGLPRAMQQAVEARWGAAEADPLFQPSRLDCGHFGISGFRTGNIAVLSGPTDIDLTAPPRHSRLAVYAWLADVFRADAVINLGQNDPRITHPASDADHFAAAILGRLPRLGAFVTGDPGV